MIFPRSRLEGREVGKTSNSRIAFLSSAAFCRSSRLASVSRYRVCATEAGPRASLSSKTSITKSPPAFDTCNMSFTWTSRAGLANCPLDRILPSSHARADKARVLKNLAAHSHLSILTPVINPFCYKLGSSNRQTLSSSNLNNIYHINSSIHSNPIRQRLN